MSTPEEILEQLRALSDPKRERGHEALAERLAARGRCLQQLAELDLAALDEARRQALREGIESVLAADGQLLAGLRKEMDKIQEALGRAKAGRRTLRGYLGAAGRREPGIDRIA